MFHVTVIASSVVNAIEFGHERKLSARLAPALVTSSAHTLLLVSEMERPVLLVNPAAVASTRSDPAAVLARGTMIEVPNWESDDAAYRSVIVNATVYRLLTVRAVTNREVIDADDVAVQLVFAAFCLCAPAIGRVKPRVSPAGT